ncbi:BON domain-containing protein [Trinickia violacea]|uniref:BON domain-containing protein n=1 Tax=Trinickia violacea TaxID=2571746 RepID=A0A4P8IYJ0_9BURK|nr:BON domain-containing protein [Trinickia violacea]QCP52633.1 BON domain-containing protein [Trinickia violacea]
MKIIKAFRLAGAGLIALTCAHTWAQGSETGAGAASNQAAVAASGGMSAKDARKANRALRRQVYAAIVKHKEINAGDISVIAKGSAVTLDGTVTDASQIDKVAEIAKGVPGVASVTNQLTVRKSFGGQ